MYKLLTICYNLYMQALIWGAAGGIGSALTRQLLTLGWDVAAFSRNGVSIGHAKSFEATFTNLTSIDRAVYSVYSRFNEADLYVYAAGDIAQETVDEMQASTFTRVLHNNLTGAYITAKASITLLKPDAPMVFIGAVSERLQLPGLSAYAAAKAGLEAFLSTFQKEQHQRRIINVRPGAVDTQFWDKVQLRKPKDIATPDQIATRIIEAVQSDHKGNLDITH